MGNIIILGDINCEPLEQAISEFCDIISKIDTPFQISTTDVTGITDFHMIFTVLRIKYKKGPPPPKNIYIYTEIQRFSLKI